MQSHISVADSLQHNNALNWLAYLGRVFVPELLPGTEEYQRVLYEYEETINSLPFVQNQSTNNLSQ
ncbi:hypothetical protein LVD17_24310 [Fulvivirga ulvae]|uniref:hypothetical protein n=1 Tax=Fulvivirga ulvae TaxID=2904245 RepID=UPI001F1EC0E8|nr:hypothetical protein [Fulvivirga ulvae]UII31420.1 hypothetical protein LVD17_24310 [Fulvivirga ulvae]